MNFYLCRTYRLSQHVKPLIWVECQIERHSRSRIEYLVKARSQFKERSTATSVEILLPLPSDAISPVVKSTQVNFGFVCTNENISCVYIYVCLCVCVYDAG